MSSLGPPGRVLILGGTGFLGAEISKMFMEAGAHVTVMARSAPDGPLADDLDGAHFVAGSVADGRLLASLVERTDHVVHAVGCPFPAESNLDPVGDLMATIPGLIGLLEAIGSRKNVDLTFLSSGGTVYGNPRTCPVAESHLCDPITPYGVTKLTAEKYIGLYSGRLGIRSRILRVANAYGARQSAARGQGLVAAAFTAAMSGSEITLYGNSVVRDYIDARDVAKAVVALAACREGPMVVNVGSGHGHSVAEVVDIVEGVTGTLLNVVHAPSRPFDVQEIVLDVGVLRRLVGWEPFSLEDGVQDAWSLLERNQPSSDVLS